MPAEKQPRCIGLNAAIAPRERRAPSPTSPPLARGSQQPPPLARRRSLGRDLRMLRQFLLRTRVRAFPCRNLFGGVHRCLNVTPSRCSAIMGAREVRASHQVAPDGSSSRRICFCALPRDATTGFQLHEDRPLTKDHEHIGKPASHAALLLEDAADTRDRLVLQRGPERAGRVKVSSQQSGKLGLLVPLLFSALTPTLHGQRLGRGALRHDVNPGHCRHPPPHTAAESVLLAGSHRRWRQCPLQPSSGCPAPLRCRA